MSNFNNSSNGAPPRRSIKVRTISENQPVSSAKKMRSQSSPETGTARRHNISYPPARTQTRNVRNTSNQKHAPSTGNSGISLKKFSITVTIVTLIIVIPLLIFAFQKTATPSEEELAKTKNEISKLSVATAPPTEPVAPSSQIDSDDTEKEDDSSSTTPDNVLYQKGDTNDELLKIQSRLMKLGYMIEAETTNYFGPATKEAIMRFQGLNQLNQTGAIDQSTYDTLFSNNAKAFSFSEGSSGSDVAEIQNCLKKLGYLSSVTSYYGSETKNAVIQFQKINGLTADGTIGINTYTLLKSSNAKKYVAPTATPAPTKTATPTETAAPTEAAAPTETVAPSAENA